LKTLKEILGTKLKRVREDKNLNQIELAEAAGIQRQALGLLEGGKTWPDYSTIQALVGALQIEEHTLLETNEIASALILSKLDDLKQTIKNLSTEKSDGLLPNKKLLFEFISKVSEDDCREIIDLLRDLSASDESKDWATKLGSKTS
jgi:transcriptional regulator with XRE-family HTH domain